ncbi:MAG: tRNA pseudouridine(38-40) synthase TruA [Bacteroidia bacterium]|jgi:tRNA pseudouridine38-40 synthase|nr:tRNA pseudouridine(38-40) synthase TruA [Bacteroidia bacterium]
MPFRYALKLAYNGRMYNGWQKQQNAIGVQAVIEEKLSMLLHEQIEIVGCGRTDTGVHAKVYYAHFDVLKPLNNADKIIFKLNQILNPSIAFYECVQVADHFNARFDAEWREYQYFIATTPNPFTTEYTWYRYGKLRVDLMNEAAKLFIGEHDFECFSKVHTQVNNFFCNVMHAEWTETETNLIFTIKANRFLRNMVRAIVGTLVEVGQEKINLSDVKKIMESKNRSEAGKSVPAQALFLTNVVYPVHKLPESNTLMR